jgi:hypothetical protein
MSGVRNPWVTRPSNGQEQKDTAGEAAAATVPAMTGASAPQPGVPQPDAVDRLPLRGTSRTALLWWVGVHGGAGESTLSALMPGSRAAGHAWPVPDAGYDVSPNPVVLVARTDLHGLRQVQRAAVQWASGAVPGVQLLGVVLMADAPGRLPRPLRDFAAVVGGGVPRVWRLPWVEAWRYQEDPTLTVPDEVHRVLRELQALVPNQ